MSNMQRYFQFLLFSLLITAVDFAFFPTNGAADDVTDYFEALRKPENKTPAKQAALRKKAEDARVNEVNKENEEYKKKVRRLPEDRPSASQAGKPGGYSDSPTKETSSPVNVSAPLTEQNSPSKSAPTEVKLDDYRKELRSPVANPTPKKTR